MVHLWPCSMTCYTYFIFSLTGDDCYPENVSLASILEIPKLDETEEENLRRCKNLHRITFYSSRSLKFDCNIKLPHKEHPPQNFNSQDWVNQSTAWVQWKGWLSGPLAFLGALGKLSWYSLDIPIDGTASFGALWSYSHTVMWTLWELWQNQLDMK